MIDLVQSASLRMFKSTNVALVSWGWMPASQLSCTRVLNLAPLADVPTAMHTDASRAH